MTEQWSPEASLRLDRSAQVPLIAGLAACVGIAIGCSGPWVEFAVFSISGLDIRAWGKIWIGVALVSAALLGVVLSAQRFRLRPQVALSLLWGVFLAAVACAAFAFPYVIRVLTLPRTEFLGLSIGANVGWGLWLLALSAGALGVAAAMAANQVGRVCDAVAASWGAPSVTRRYRQIALALAATVTVGWIGYYGSTWDGGPPGSDSAGKRAGSEWPLGDQPDSESSSSAAPTYATVGEPIQLGDFQVEVLGIWLQKVIGDGFRSYEPRGIWVVAVMEVTNTGSEEQSFDTDGQELIVDGRTYSSNTWAAKYVASDVYQFLVLNPGLSEYAVAVFDVPPGIFPASEAALNLKSDSGDPDVRVQLDTSPQVRSSASEPTTRTQRPSTTRRSAPSAPSAPVGVPPRASPDLGLDVPLSRPSCDGTGIVVLGSAYTPGKYRQEVARMLSLNPGASYLRTDLACPSLRQEVNGNPIYAVYRVAGTTRAQVCAAVAAAGKGTYGKWLDTDSDPAAGIDCGRR